MRDPQALLVMPPERQEEFRRAVSSSRLRWTSLGSCTEARSALRSGTDFVVVVAELRLNDGNWYCVLDEMVRRGLEANLIVVLPSGAKRINAANYGVYGVLRRPLDASAAEMVEAAAHVFPGRA